MAPRFYRNAEGDYLGAFDGAPSPAGGIEVGVAPADARAVWSGSAWEVPAALLLAEERAAMLLTDIQFGLICADRGWMTLQEAEDWCGDGSLPQRAIDAIATLPEALRGAARVRFRGAREIFRSDPFLPVLQAIDPAITDDALDQAFRDGALL